MCKQGLILNCLSVDLVLCNNKVKGVFCYLDFYVKRIKDLFTSGALGDRISFI